MPEQPTPIPNLFEVGLTLNLVAKKSRVSLLKVTDLEQIGTRIGDIATTPPEQQGQRFQEFEEWLGQLLLVDQEPPAQG